MDAIVHKIDETQQQETMRYPSEAHPTYNQLNTAKWLIQQTIHVQQKALFRG
jgi:hypothetical protein